MTPDLLWALMFSFRCETTEVVYYERRVSEITNRCVSTEVTRYLLSDAQTLVAAEGKGPNLSKAADDVRAAPKVTKAAVKKKAVKKKPTKKKRKKRARRS